MWRLSLAITLVCAATARSQSAPDTAPVNLNVTLTVDLDPGRELAGLYAIASDQVFENRSVPYNLIIDIIPKP